MSRTLFFFTLMVCLPLLTVYSQAIDMAEIKQDGIVIPVVNHTAVQGPSEGQLIFNPMTNSLWYWDGGQWYEIGADAEIIDNDGDTEIKVDDGFDPDEIVFTTEGKEYGRIKQGAHGVHVFSLSDVDNSQDNNVVFGRNSGLNIDTAGFCCNALFGDEAGRELRIGDTNTFIGNGAGRSTSSGSANTFVGNDAGDNNVMGRDNVYIGHSAGASNEGDGNVFIGPSAGRSFATVSNRLAIDNTDTNMPLISGEFDTRLLTIHGKTELRDQSGVIIMEAFYDGFNGQVRVLGLVSSNAVEAEIANISNFIKLKERTVLPSPSCASTSDEGTIYYGTNMIGGGQVNNALWLCKETTTNNYQWTQLD